MNFGLSLSQMASMTLPVTILLAFGLDLLLGDPQGWPHIVRLVGKIIATLERLLNRPLLSERQRLARGFLMGLALPAGLTLFLTAFLWLLFRLSLPLWFFARLLLCWQLLALKDLADEAGAVALKLRKQGLPAARQSLSRIVGRDTAELTEEEVCKAAVETVAENFADGVIAPLFFLCLFDLPGMFFLKCVNTLDSMIGYKNVRYKDFGKVSAKCDDVLNFLPSRLAALLLLLACPFLRLDIKSAWNIFKRDRLKHASPNSGQTEAVVAGALGLQLGGSHKYFGQEVFKPTIGDPRRHAEASDIDLSIRLLYLAGFMALFFAMGVAWLKWLKL